MNDKKELVYHESMCEDNDVLVYQFRFDVYDVLVRKWLESGDETIVLLNGSSIIHSGQIIESHREQWIARARLAWEKKNEKATSRLISVADLTPEERLACIRGYLGRNNIK